MRREILSPREKALFGRIAHNWRQKDCRHQFLFSVSFPSLLAYSPPAFLLFPITLPFLPLPSPQTFPTITPFLPCHLSLPLRIHPCPAHLAPFPLRFVLRFLPRARKSEFQPVVGGGHSIAPNTISANAASASS